MNLKDLFRGLHIEFLRMRCAFRPAFRPEKRTVIIAPHPDDEVIGCGGLITRMVAEGNAPHVIILTGGEGSLGKDCDVNPEKIVNARRGLTRKAIAELGLPIENIHEFNLGDGRIGDSPEQQLEEIRECLASLNPDTLLLPHWGEGWRDHVVVKSLFTDNLPGGCEVWEYCVWMWYYNVWRGLDWRNAAVVRLTPGEQSKKNRAIDAYITPLSPCGRPWSGDLPSLFIKAHRGPIELYFKCVNSL